MKVGILGTEYRITNKDDKTVCEEMKCELGECGGYCNEYSHEIVIANLDTCEDTEQLKQALRIRNLIHEIVHAFLSESGMSANANYTSCWAKNEEMVDWIAIQFPKILKVLKEAGCL